MQSKSANTVQLANRRSFYERVRKLGRGVLRHHFFMLTLVRGIRTHLLRFCAGCCWWLLDDRVLHQNYGNYHGEAQARCACYG